jgi:hypothetical protein
MVDEMDLVSQLRDAAPPRSEAYERARAALREAMAESARGPELVSVPEAAPVRGRGSSRARSRRRAVGTRGTIGIGAGIGMAAGAVAIALIATSSPRSAAPVASPSQAPATSQRPAASQQPAASQRPAASSPLVSLAAYITAHSGPLPGNASLIIRTQAIGDRQPDVVYELYTDSGALYSGDDKATLLQAVARHANLADGMDAADVKAALYAAAGNLTTAREQMATVSPGDAWLYLTGAAQRAAWEKGMAQTWPILKAKGMKTPPKMPTGAALQAIINNRIWNNSVEALSAGGGNPEVRAGVLRLLSTIPEVTVANSTTGGQPTLTVTAGPEVFGGTGKQVLTVNARTGMPVSSWVGDLGQQVPSSVDTYKVTRVTLAHIEAGQF